MWFQPCQWSQVDILMSMVETKPGVCNSWTLSSKNDQLVKCCLHQEVKNWRKQNNMLLTYETNQFVTNDTSEFLLHPHPHSKLPCKSKEWKPGHSDGDLNNLGCDYSLQFDRGKSLTSVSQLCLYTYTHMHVKCPHWLSDLLRIWKLENLHSVYQPSRWSSQSPQGREC